MNINYFHLVFYHILHENVSFVQCKWKLKWLLVIAYKLQSQLNNTFLQILTAAIFWNYISNTKD